jgi:hypothetical protein
MGTAIDFAVRIERSNHIDLYDTEALAQSQHIWVLVFL